ncbi:MAG: sulfite exporter TauE/SafE family protein [Fuerstiella sp.]
MHTHSHQITMGLAFFLGAVHALEPGHGKTAMLVYLSDQRRNILHPILMGVSSAVSHSLSLIGIAFLIHAAQYALTGSASDASELAQFWLRALSSVVVIAVGIWMLIGARRDSVPTPCGCRHHRDHEHDQDPDSVKNANQKTGYSASMLLGAAFGMLPCPSAVAAYLTGMAHGSPVEAYASIGLFACGIATSLAVVGILVQRFGKRLTNGSHRLSKLPWAMIRAVVVLLVGAGAGVSLYLR